MYHEKAEGAKMRIAFGGPRMGRDTKPAIFEAASVRRRFGFC